MWQQACSVWPGYFAIFFILQVVNHTLLSFIKQICLWGIDNKSRSFLDPSVTFYQFTTQRDELPACLQHCSMEANLFSLQHFNTSASTHWTAALTKQVLTWECTGCKTIATHWIPAGGSAYTDYLQEPKRIYDWIDCNYPHTPPHQDCSDDSIAKSLTGFKCLFFNLLYSIYTSPIVKDTTSLKLFCFYLGSVGMPHMSSCVVWLLNCWTFKIKKVDTVR